MDGSLKLATRAIHDCRRDPLDFEAGGVLPRAGPVPVPMAAPDMGCHMPSGLAAILTLRLMLVDAADLRELRGDAETDIMDGAIGLTALAGLVLLGAYTVRTSASFEEMYMRVPRSFSRS